MSGERPGLVVVTGPPASGKTTVAVAVATALGWPLHTKDGFKELLFDTLGTGDLAWSSRLGGAATALLELVAETELRAGRELVLEANFRRLGPLPPCRPVQVFCTDEAGALERRYRARRRHPGHVDDLRTPDPRDYAPLDLDGPVLGYRVGDDVEALIAEVRRCV